MLGQQRQSVCRPSALFLLLLLFVSTTQAQFSSGSQVALGDTDVPDSSMLFFGQETNAPSKYSAAAIDCEVRHGSLLSLIGENDDDQPFNIYRLLTFMKGLDSKYSGTHVNFFDSQSRVVDVTRDPSVYGFIRRTPTSGYRSVTVCQRNSNSPPCASEYGSDGTCKDVPKLYQSKSGVRYFWPDLVATDISRATELCKALRMDVASTTDTTFDVRALSATLNKNFKSEDICRIGHACRSNGTLSNVLCTMPSDIKCATPGYSAFWARTTNNLYASADTNEGKRQACIANRGVLSDNTPAENCLSGPPASTFNAVQCHRPVAVCNDYIKVVTPANVDFASQQYTYKEAKERCNQEGMKVYDPAECDLNLTTWIETNFDNVTVVTPDMAGTDQTAAGILCFMITGRTPFARDNIFLASVSAHAPTAASATDTCARQEASIAITHYPNKLESFLMYHNIQNLKSEYRNARVLIINGLRSVAAMTAHNYTLQNSTTSDGPFPFLLFCKRHAPLPCLSGFFSDGNCKDVYQSHAGIRYYLTRMKPLNYRTAELICKARHMKVASLDDTFNKTAFQQIYNYTLTDDICTSSFCFSRDLLCTDSDYKCNALLHFFWARTSSGDYAIAKNFSAAKGLCRSNGGILQRSGNTERSYKKCVTDMWVSLGEGKLIPPSALVTSTTGLPSLPTGITLFSFSDSPTKSSTHGIPVLCERPTANCGNQDSMVSVPPNHMTRSGQLHATDACNAYGMTAITEQPKTSATCGYYVWNAVNPRYLCRRDKTTLLEYTKVPSSDAYIIKSNSACTFPASNPNLNDIGVRALIVRHYEESDSYSLKITRHVLGQGNMVLELTRNGENLLSSPILSQINAIHICMSVPGKMFLGSSAIDQPASLSESETICRERDGVLLNRDPFNKDEVDAFVRRTGIANAKVVFYHSHKTVPDVYPSGGSSGPYLTLCTRSTKPPCKSGFGMDGNCKDSYTSLAGVRYFWPRVPASSLRDATKICRRYNMDVARKDSTFSLADMANAFDATFNGDTFMRMEDSVTSPRQVLCQVADFRCKRVYDYFWARELNVPNQYVYSKTTAEMQNICVQRSALLYDKRNYMLTEACLDAMLSYLPGGSQPVSKDNFKDDSSLDLKPVLCFRPMHKCHTSQGWQAVVVPPNADYRRVFTAQEKKQACEAYRMTTIPANPLCKHALGGWQGLVRSLLHVQGQTGILCYQTSSLELEFHITNFGVPEVSQLRILNPTTATKPMPFSNIEGYVYSPTYSINGHKSAISPSTIYQPTAVCSQSGGDILHLTPNDNLPFANPFDLPHTYNEVRGLHRVHLSEIVKQWNYPNLYPNFNKKIYRIRCQRLSEPCIGVGQLVVPHKVDFRTKYPVNHGLCSNAAGTLTDFSMNSNTVKCVAKLQKRAVILYNLPFWPEVWSDTDTLSTANPGEKRHVVCIVRNTGYAPEQYYTLEFRDDRTESFSGYV